MQDRTHDSSTKTLAPHGRTIHWVIARRDGKKVRLISRTGKDLSYRFPLADQAVAALPVHSCIIDGEAIVSDTTGLAVFSLIRSYRNGPRATLCAFDLVEIDGQDLR